jgi:hypothetical protein
MLTSEQTGDRRIAQDCAARSAFSMVTLFTPWKGKSPVSSPVGNAYTVTGHLSHGNELLNAFQDRFRLFNLLQENIL